ncbi:hypothetical protein BD560DRAFT_478132 [Blakeslea trispora]|nr:hypothetical protein BD560DRAFT_478131 [Blakeslea trispora]KAI8350852.1 hypothetical protein BD560DRAFT_478132 [Blakeslea trispora]
MQSGQEEKNMASKKRKEREQPGTVQGGVDSDQVKDKAEEMTADELYDAIMSGAIDMMEYLKFDEEFYESLKFKGFDARTIYKDTLKNFGFKAAIRLSLFGTIGRNNISRFANNIIPCNGVKYKGDITLSEMFKRGLIGRVGTRSPTEKIKPGVYPITQIASAIPYATYLYVKGKEKRNKDISSYAKNIDTSLPVCLQYVEAGSLPLPEKLRKAHIAFIENYSKRLRRGLDGNIYRHQVLGSYLYKRVPGLVDELNEEESKIVLKDFEASKSVESILKNSRMFNNKPSQEGSYVSLPRHRQGLKRKLG